MMHSIVRYPLLPSLLLAGFLFSLLCSARTVTVGDICPKHPNPNNCDIIMMTIPGITEGADIDRLSSYFIRLGLSKTFDSVTLITEIIANSTDTQLELRYNSCTMDHTDAAIYLSEVRSSFSSGNFDAMKSNCAVVIKDVQDCDTKAYDSPPLRMMNQGLVDVTNIVVILADFLAGKY
ncbi:hypothetical protein Fmac_029275 [Flemingia macrophylla]|uniref:Pectinesterase inhibitor domain-containing protein n=1 Tax=Flemingia macrophylla TaxID=520843 RepID=A0ABD1L9V7_9FABA